MDTYSIPEGSAGARQSELQSLKSVVVIGAGTMGAGIVQVAATHGWIAYLEDVDGNAVERALVGIRKRLDRLVAKGTLSTSDRNEISTRLHPLVYDQAPTDVDLAIEAVVEDLSIKQNVFRLLQESVGPNAILATNTSSLPVSRIAEAVADPGRVVGMHFFNPAPLMPLVEIIAAKQSSAAALDHATIVAQSWGKVTVQAKDTPGFIVNRVARGFYLEALRLLGEGVGGIDEIDQVMRRFGKFKMGPFELMDLVGLDVNLAVTTSVWEQMSRAARFAPHEIQQSLVAKGRLGRKTKRGFYAYDDGGALPAYSVERRSYSVSPLMSDVIRAFAGRAGAGDAGTTEQFILARILIAVLNEAAWALADGVATREDIDLAMLKGTSYPKGPLAWADEIGPRTVRGVLHALNGAVNDKRYASAPYFANAASEPTQSCVAPSSDALSASVAPFSDAPKTSVSPSSDAPSASVAPQSQPQCEIDPFRNSFSYR